MVLFMGDFLPRVSLREVLSLRCALIHSISARSVGRSLKSSMASAKPRLGLTGSGRPAKSGGAGVEGSGGEGVERSRGEGVEGAEGSGGAGAEGDEEGGAFGVVEVGARIGGEAIRWLAANLDPGTASTRPSIRPSITLLFPENTSASRFLFPPTSKRNSPSSFAFFLTGPPSSPPSLTLFPSTCGSTALGIDFCWPKSRPRGDHALIVGLKAARVGLVAARLKTILIVFGLDGVGAGIGAGGRGVVSARGSRGVSSCGSDGVASRGSGGVTARGGRRRTVAGAAGAAVAGSSATGSGIAGAIAAAVSAVPAINSLAGLGSASIGLSSALRLLLASGCNTWLSESSPRNDAPGDWNSSLGALDPVTRGVGSCIECDDGIGGSASNGVVSPTDSQSISVTPEASISGAVSISVPSNATHS